MELAKKVNKDRFLPGCNLPVILASRLFKWSLRFGRMDVAFPLAVDMMKIYPKRVWYEMFIVMFESCAIFLNPVLLCELHREHESWLDNCSNMGTEHTPSSLVHLEKAMQIVCSASKFQFLKLVALVITDLESGEIFDEVWSEHPDNEQDFMECIEPPQKDIVLALCKSFVSNIQKCLRGCTFSNEYTVVYALMMLCFHGKHDLLWILIHKLIELEEKLRHLAEFAQLCHGISSSVAKPDGWSTFPCFKQWGRERYILITMVFLMTRAASTSNDVFQHWKGSRGSESEEMRMGEFTKRTSVSIDQPWFFQVKEDRGWNLAKVVKAEVRHMHDFCQFSGSMGLIVDYRFPVNGEDKPWVWYEHFFAPKRNLSDPNCRATRIDEGEWNKRFGGTALTVYLRSGGTFSVKKIMQADGSFALDENPSKPSNVLSQSAPEMGHRSRELRRRALLIQRLHSAPSVPQWMNSLLFVKDCQVLEGRNYVTVSSEHSAECRVQFNMTDLRVIEKNAGSPEPPAWVTDDTSWIVQPIHVAETALQFMSFMKFRGMLDPEQLVLARWEVYSNKNGRAMGSDQIVAVTHQNFVLKDCWTTNDLTLLIRQAPLHFLAELLVRALLRITGISRTTFLLSHSLESGACFLSLEEFPKDNLYIMPRSYQPIGRYNPLEEDASHTNSLTLQIKDFLEEEGVQQAAEILLSEWETVLRRYAPSIGKQSRVDRLMRKSERSLHLDEMVKSSLLCFDAWKMSRETLQQKIIKRIF